MRLDTIALTLGLGLVSLGCTKHGDDTPSAASTAQVTGVAECDDYIAKYEACIKKS